MGGINSSIQEALKADRILPRNRAGPGFWLSFLLPLAVILGDYNTEGSTSEYFLCSLYTFNTFLNVFVLLFHIYIYKSTNVTKRINVFCAIPVVISCGLYNELLGDGIWKNLCYTVGNGLIYFEGIQFLFKAFPKTFTFGEVNIAIQGFSLFIFALYTRLIETVGQETFTDEPFLSTVILQLTFPWIVLFCIVPFSSGQLRGAKFIYFWGLTVLACIYASVYWVLKRDLLLWMWNFLTKPGRVGVVALWAVCSAAAVGIVQRQISEKRKSNTILRKYFHILATVVFLSGTFLDETLIYFSSGCVFCLFIVLEAFRLLRLPPFHEFLQNGLTVYKDEKDSGVLALTPICLLVGMSLPFWLHPSAEYTKVQRLQVLSGVLSVGIGDTFASVGGKLFGKHLWKGSSKTIEGTIFGIVSQVIFVEVLVYFQLIENPTDSFVKNLIPILITSLVEAKTDQIDNIVLPLVMYILFICI